jgi:hypothetical protein
LYILKYWGAKIVKKSGIVRDLTNLAKKSCLLIGLHLTAALFFFNIA